MIAKVKDVVRVVVAAGLLAAACAPAPPGTGSRDPDAQIDPEYPEINCKL